MSFKYTYNGNVMFASKIHESSLYFHNLYVDQSLFFFLL